MLASSLQTEDPPRIECLGSVSYFPQNSLSPVEIDWAAEAVDSVVTALVGRSSARSKAS